jgi:hypothetical protein
MNLILVVLCIPLILLLTSEVYATTIQLQEPRRIVAMGDLHGDLHNTKKILRLAGLINDKDQWSGGDTIYVQTVCIFSLAYFPRTNPYTFSIKGDVLDRGTDTIELYDLIQRLRSEAPEQGGLVIPLLGNHEIMNLAGDWRYVSKKEMATFGGHSKRVEAFQPDGFIGEYLVQLNMTTKVGGTVFCHGGINPDFAKKGVDQINDNVRRDLLRYMASGADPHGIFGGHGPTWYRGYALDDEPGICAVADKALTYMKVSFAGNVTRKY